MYTKVVVGIIPTASTEDGDKKVLYYINDGVYGSFNCLMYDHYVPNPIPASEYIRKLEQHVNESYVTINPPTAEVNMAPPVLMQQQSAGFSSSTRSKTVGTFFGPTCDSMDKIVQDYPISELEVGDWVVFENMGAYTTAAATRFNGCPLASVQYSHSLTV